MFYGYNPAYFLAFLALAFYPFEHLSMKLFRGLQTVNAACLSDFVDRLGGTSELAWPHI